MPRANDREVPSIECRHSAHAESFGKRHYRRIDGPQRQVVILADELRDPDPIRREHRLGNEISGGQIAKETHLRLPAEACFDQIGDFGDDQLRYEQRTRMGFQQTQARFVVTVILIDVRVQRTGVDDQRDLWISSRMISSMRRAVSCRPLRPALAAISFRRERFPR